MRKIPIRKVEKATDANPVETLGNLFKEPLPGEAWLPSDTAILVVHGVGDQNPLETLDTFTRGLVEACDPGARNLEIEHRLARKSASGSSTPWFDNFLRIRSRTTNAGTAPHLDVYEYYWAAQTEDKAGLGDVQTWLENVSRGARRFYRENAALGANSKDRSSFFHRDGSFRSGRYYVYVNMLPKLLILTGYLMGPLFSLLTMIPVVGRLFSPFLRSTLHRKLAGIINLVNDVTIYNTTDAKSRFFEVRNCILDGAVSALRYLVEATDDEGKAFRYRRVLVVGHSLGSQIVFDAMNRLNHLTSQGEIKGYGCDGVCQAGGGKMPPRLEDRFAGLVTFGSPLDKIAFFLREQVPDTEYLRSQIIGNFHGFKQRNWLRKPPAGKHLLTSGPKRLLDNVPWRNYFDDNDYVSGALDFYHDVTNIDCKFGSDFFTHSHYWTCTMMYKEIFRMMLNAGPGTGGNAVAPQAGAVPGPETTEREEPVAGTAGVPAPAVS